MDRISGNSDTLEKQRRISGCFLRFLHVGSVFSRIVMNVIQNHANQPVTFRPGGSMEKGQIQPEGNHASYYG